MTMTKWQYTSVNLKPGESWYDALRQYGREGWEAWHIDRNETGWREIYFKRPAGDGEQGVEK